MPGWSEWVNAKEKEKRRKKCNVKRDSWAQGPVTHIHPVNCTGNAAANAQAGERAQTPTCARQQTYMQVSRRAGTHTLTHTHGHKHTNAPTHTCECARTKCTRQSHTQPHTHTHKCINVTRVIAHLNVCQLSLHEEDVRGRKQNQNEKETQRHRYKGNSSPPLRIYTAPREFISPRPTVASQKPEM